MPTTTHEFRVLLVGPLTDEDADTLYEAMPDDVGVETGPLGSWVAFEREGDTLYDAALEAVAQLIEAGFEPCRVEADAVSATEIADRLHKTRSAVSMIVKGERGDGTFPLPAGGAGRSPFWYWEDVAAWNALSDEDRRRANRVGGVAQQIAALNGALAQRTMARTAEHRRRVEKARKLLNA